MFNLKWSYYIFVVVFSSQKDVSIISQHDYVWYMLCFQ